MGALTQLSAQHTIAQTSSLTGRAIEPPTRIPGVSPVEAVTKTVAGDWGQLQGLFSEFHLPSVAPSSIPPVELKAFGSVPAVQRLDPIGLLRGQVNQFRHLIGL